MITLFHYQLLEQLYEVESILNITRMLVRINMEFQFTGIRYERARPSANVHIQILENKRFPEQRKNESLSS